MEMNVGFLATEICMLFVKKSNPILGSGKFNGPQFWTELLHME